jgi:hypothetical protein
MRGTSAQFQSAALKIARATVAVVVVTGALLATAAPSFADGATVPDAPVQPAVTTAAGNVTVSFTPRTRSATARSPTRRTRSSPPPLPARRW